MNTIPYLGPVQFSPFAPVAPGAREAMDKAAGLLKVLDSAWDLKKRTADKDFDLYSPPTSYWSKAQNYPGEKSIETGYEILKVAGQNMGYAEEHGANPGKQLLYDIPFISLTGAGLDVVGESMLKSLLNRFELFDEFEVFLKRDPGALKQGYLVGHTPYEAARLQRLCPEKYTDWSLRGMGTDGGKEFLAWRAEKEKKDLDAYNSDPDHSQPVEPSQLLKDVSEGKTSGKWTEGDLSKYLEWEAGRDPQTKLIAGINLGRWYWPYILQPALYSGIDTMWQTTTGLQMYDRDSYVPEFSNLGEPPPLWQGEDVPEHPWQGKGPSSPWMTKATPQHAFEMKSPWEIAMEKGEIKVAGYPEPSTKDEEQEWFETAEQLWEGNREFEEFDDDDFQVSLDKWRG